MAIFSWNESYASYSRPTGNESEYDGYSGPLELQEQLKHIRLRQTFRLRQKLLTSLREKGIDYGISNSIPERYCRFETIKASKGGVPCHWGMFMSRIIHKMVNYRFNLFQTWFLLRIVD
ncbi:hypothetical protein C5167_005839 [Papaver somniferum]|uniref:Uncharacterized protein n=1 Tax=Papaver somniferum TaxID=3469 RepID=A0A4Y7JCJ0_PAPSO|nr:hypothetical protein C5167_005839 [Papaver somniferum]